MLNIMNFFDYDEFYKAVKEEYVTEKFITEQLNALLQSDLFLECVEEIIAERLNQYCERQELNTDLTDELVTNLSSEMSYEISDFVRNKIAIIS